MFCSALLFPTSSIISGINKLIAVNAEVMPEESKYMMGNN